MFLKEIKIIKMEEVRKILNPYRKDLVKKTYFYEYVKVKIWLDYFDIIQKEPIKPDQKETLRKSLKIIYSDLCLDWCNERDLLLSLMDYLYGQLN